MGLKNTLRKLPPSAKIIALALSGFIIFNLDIIPCIFFFVLIFALSLLSNLSITKQLKAQRATLAYSMALYFVHIFENVFSLFKGKSFVLSDFLIPDEITIRIIIRLICAIQAAALFYHTTTNLEIRRGISDIEIAIRNIFSRKKSIKPQFSHSLSLMLTFIPEILLSWNELNKAWKARGGKNGLSKMKKLIPALISLSMNKAYKTALALISRNPS